METVYSILTGIIGVVGSVWILYKLRNLDRDRADEDHARVFFDEHGHWPDQTPEEAQAERARLLEQGAHHVPVATPTSDGYV